MDQARKDSKNENQLWEDVYLAPEEEVMNPEEVSTSYFPNAPSDRSYQYIPGRGMSRYYPALRHLVPFQRKKQNKKTLSVDNSGPWSFITYNWLTKYISKAYKEGLNLDDIPDPNPQDTCDFNVHRLETFWQDELIKKGPQSASLSYATWRFVKTRVMIVCILLCICLILGFVNVAYFMRYLLEYAEAENGSWTTGLKWAVLLSVFELVRVVFYAMLWSMSFRTGMRLRSAFLGMLYRKILRVHSLGDKSIGELINVFTNDGQRVHDLVILAPMMIGGPISILLGIIYVLWILGPWPLIGLCCIFIFYPVQYLLQRVIGLLKRKVFIVTDNRLTLVSEILNSIKFLKLYAWSKIYIEKVSGVRKKELSLLEKASFLQSCTSSLSTNAPVIAAILTFLIHILVEKNITVSQAFTVITLYFKLLRNVLHFTRDGFRSLTDFKYTVQRFKSVMLLNETTTLLSRPVDKSQAVCIADGRFARYLNIDQNKIHKMRKRKNRRRSTANAEEIERDLLNNPIPSNYSEILFDINFFAPRGSLVGICGPVGCGKTSLLSGILGHLCLTKGKLCREGSCAYVSQQAWLLNATVRENILFGEKFVPKRYYNVIRCCDLTKDIDSLPGGDNTEIGERGVNLSGGQKQRIALARAVYADRDIYLLDDPLSAVDVEVANYIFEKCILNALQSKTVLFVSHQVQFLNICNEIVVMKDGRIVERGSPSELLSKDSEYKLMMDTFNTRSAKQDLELRCKEEKTVSSLANGSTSSETHKQHSENSKPEGLGTLIKEETIIRGSIKTNTLYSYIKACGGMLSFSVLLLIMLLNMGSQTFSSWWLHMWINAGSGSNNTILTDENITIVTNSTGNIADNPNFTIYQNVYCSIIGVIFLTNIIRGYAFTKITLKASAAIHRGLIYKMMKAKMQFFETTPVGRIQNLFSKDIDEVETRLPPTLETLIQGMWSMVFSILFICIAFPYFLIPFVFICVLYYYIIKMFRAGLRDLKRLDNMTRSPVLSNISTTIQGLDSIHAFGKEKGFIYRFNTSFDLNSTCFYMTHIASRWLALRIDGIGILIMLITSLLLIAMHGIVPPSLAGLALSYAIALCGMFQQTVRLLADNEVKLISLERINSYLQYMEEEGGHGPKGVPKDTWPELGSIRFTNVELKYRDELEPVLKASFHFRSEEKIGIVGRTGAGKSSIVTALFRLVEVSKGSITIDNLDISTLELTSLRSKMSIIPQDPVLFSGTIRTNLDPGNDYNDEEVWSVLEKVNLKNKISSNEDKLHSKVSFNGDNFSTGEKQLLCLARAMLRKSKILVLDEATSGLDIEAERVIQKTIFTDMKHCTVIIIAHRLETIQACNRILVMKNGEVIEFDQPATLLQNPNSTFYRMINASNSNQTIS